MPFYLKRAGSVLAPRISTRKPAPGLAAWPLHRITSARPPQCRKPGTGPVARDPWPVVGRIVAGGPWAVVLVAWAVAGALAGPVSCALVAPWWRPGRGP